MSKIMSKACTHLLSEVNYLILVATPEWHPIIAAVLSEHNFTQNSNWKYNLLFWLLVIHRM